MIYLTLSGRFNKHDRLYLVQNLCRNQQLRMKTRWLCQVDGVDEIEVKIEMPNLKINFK